MNILINSIHKIFKEISKMTVGIMFILLCICIFFFIMYLVVQAAIRNSETLKEIKVLLMKSENEKK